MDIPQGQSIAVMGASGSGKSTLMNILGCLDKPTDGVYLLDGVDVSSLDDQSLSKARGGKIGFVFQSFNLIPQLTIEENVEVPLFYQKDNPVHRKQKSIEMLKKTKLQVKCLQSMH